MAKIISIILFLISALCLVFFFFLHQLVSLPQVEQIEKEKKLTARSAKLRAAEEV